jgi:hypothetical protein
MTMNLIQQQTAAKDLPLQYLQQAVNGQNPNLTPWIATAELQRRTTMDQHMQKGQGPMPTVKDQVEQKAGLMATQAAQQAQGAQMQQAATPPGPVPAGVPQPEAQPEEPVMAARGGLMNARTNLHFAKGGILGFDGEDESYVDPMTGAPLVNTSDRDNDTTLREAITRGLGFTEEAAHQKANRKTNEAAEARASGAPASREPVPATARADDRAPRPSLQGQGIKAALVDQAAQKRPPAAPQNPGIKAAVAAPAEDPTNPMLQKATSFINEQGKTPTPQDAIDQQSVYDAKYGLDKPVGEMQQKYWAQQDALQAQRQKQAKDLAWSSYVQGLVGTPGSGALAHDTTMANALNQAGEFQSQRAKDISALETAQRTANEKRATSAEGIGAAATLAAAAKNADQAKLAGQIWDSQQQTLAQRYNTDKTSETQIKVHQMMLAMSQNQFSERMRTDNYNQLNAQATQLTRDEQEASTALKTLQTNPAAAAMLGKNALTQAQEYLNQIRAQKQLVMQGMQAMSDTGAKSPAAANAARPAAPTIAPPPPGAVRLVNKG